MLSPVGPNKRVRVRQSLTRIGKTIKIRDKSCLSETDWRLYRLKSIFNVTSERPHQSQSQHGTFMKLLNVHSPFWNLQFWLHSSSSSSFSRLHTISTQKLVTKSWNFHFQGHFNSLKPFLWTSIVTLISKCHCCWKCSKMLKCSKMAKNSHKVKVKQTYLCKSLRRRHFRAF